MQHKRNKKYKQYCRRWMALGLAFVVAFSLIPGMQYVGFIDDEPVVKTAKAAAQKTFITDSNTTGRPSYGGHKLETIDGTQTSWGTGCYYVMSSISLSNVEVKPNATVFLEIRKGVTLTCTGTNGSGTTPGKPGIQLLSGATLVVLGEGTLIAKGGNAANGSSGGSGGAPSTSSKYVYSGTGGTGGNGGGGAGAGIGTAGGTGGSGGGVGSSHSHYVDHSDDGYESGSSGSSGESGGSASSSMGSLYVLGAVTVQATGGSAGSGGSGGSNNTSTVHMKRDQGKFRKDRHGYATGGAGGGGGGGGTAGAGIGIGGGGGAGGAGGGSSGTYVNDDKGNFRSWSSLQGGGGVGGSGGRNGSNGSGTRGSYGGSGGSSSRSSGSSSGTTTTVLRNNLATVTTKSYGGKSASVSARTRLSYSDQNLSIKLEDTTTGLDSRAPFNNVFTSAETPLTYGSVKMGATCFDKITDVTNAKMHKPGYKFLGWYNQETGGTKVIDVDGKVVNNVENYTVDGIYNTFYNTLYAHWERVDYHITFDANGGGYQGNIGTVSKTFYTAETLVDLDGDLAAPKRTGYFLLGYNTKKDGSGRWIYGTNKYGATNPRKDEDIKANWEKIQKERANETDERLPDGALVHQSQISANCYIKDWGTIQQTNLADDEIPWKTTVYGHNYSGVYPFEKDTTLYAQWAPIHYTLRYFSEDNTSEAKWVGEEYNVPYFNVVYKSLSDFNVTRKHYEFKGWNLYASQDWGMYQPNQLYRTSLTEEDGDTVSLYAAWKMTDSYSIYYNANGGAGAPVTGFTFKDSLKTDDDVYKISKKIPTRTNYTFKGWNTEIDGNGTTWVEDTPVVGLTDNLTLYAQWEQNPSVVYHANGGTFSITPERQYVKKEGDFTTLEGDALPTREGYKFKKWATASTVPESTNTYDAGQTVRMGADDIVLYAIWEKEGYGVTSTVVNEDPDTYRTINKYYSIYLVQNNTDIPFAGPVVNTYPPASASQGAGSAESSGGGGYAGREESLVYTAKTSDNSDFKVSYKEGFSFAIKVPEFVDSSNLLVYANGSLLLPRGKTEETKDGKKYTRFLYQISNATTAQEISVTGLKYRTYRLDFECNGGEIPAISKMNEYTYGSALTLPTPQKTGYTFEGWYSNQELSGAQVTQISGTDKDDKKFYAKWKPNTYQIRFDGTVYNTVVTGTGDHITETLVPTEKGGVTQDHSTTCTKSGLTYDVSLTLDEEVFKYHSNTTDYVGASSLLAWDNYLNDPAGEQVEFLGWSTQKGAETPEYLPGCTVKNLCTGAEGDDVITLYAVWKTSNYKLTYDANGGKIRHQFNTIADGEDEPQLTSKDVSSYTEEHQKCTAVSLNFTGVSRTGYQFLGWSTNANATSPVYYSVGTYPDGGSPVVTIPASSFSSDTVLYAVWKANTYTITFDANGGKRHVAHTNGQGAIQNRGNKKQSTITVIDAFDSRTLDSEAKVYQATDGKYYCKVEKGDSNTDLNNNQLYFELTDWNPNEGVTLTSVTVATEAGVNIDENDCIPFNHYRVAIDAAKAYPIFKYKYRSEEGQEVIKYLTVKGTLSSNSVMYELNNAVDGQNISGLTEVNQYKVNESAIRYNDINSNLSIIYDYTSVDNCVSVADESHFKQGMTSQVSAPLNQDGGTAIFDVMPGGESASNFLQETDVDGGINTFTGMYKVSTSNQFEYLLGWSTKPNATEPEFLPNEDFSHLATVNGENITLYAVWSATEKKYAVFNANGGSFTPQTGDSLSTVRDTITDRGDGKHTIVDSLLPVVCASGVSVTVENGEVTTEAGATAYQLTRPGYDFAGWSESNSIGDVNNTMASLRDGISATGSSVTYYAQWTPKKVTVRFHSNTDDEKTTTQEILYNTLTDLDPLPDTFTNPGKHFLRWATQVKDGIPVNEIGYGNGQGVFFASDKEETYKVGIDLYAIWEENKAHYVIYDANGGYGGPGMVPYIEGTEGKIYITEQYTVVTKTTDQNQVVQEQQCIVSMPECDGYRFRGWATTASATTPDAAHAYVSSTNMAESEQVTCPVWTLTGTEPLSKTLYAVWEELPKYNANYHADNATESAVSIKEDYQDGEIFKPNFDRVPEKEGYRFEGWSNVVIPTTEFIGNRDQQIPDDMIYRSGDGKTTTMAAAGVSFYPVWEPNTYTITYMTTNDESVSCSVNQISYGAQYTICGLEPSETVTGSALISALFSDQNQANAQKYLPKPGYEFIGWSSVPNASKNDVNYKAGDTVKQLTAIDGAEIILYAVYQPLKYTYTFKNKFQVSIAEDTGCVNTEDMILDKEQNKGLALGDPMPVLTEIPKKYGYTFGGYFTEKNGQGEMYYDENLVVTVAHTMVTETQDMTLYAYWIPIEFQLFYQHNGKVVASQTLQYAQPATTLAVEVMTELKLEDEEVLIGWKLDKAIPNRIDFSSEGDLVYPNCTKNYDTGMKLYNEGKNVVVYAEVGKATKSRVTYNPNGGSNEPVDDTWYVAGAKVSVKFTPVPKKAGHTFLGWAESSGAQKPTYYQTDDATDINAKQEFTISTDTVLYAIWKENSYTITYHENNPDQQSEDEHTFSVQLGYMEEGYHFADASLFSRKGYSLSGWAITPETGVTYTLNQELMTPLSAIPDGNADLYAVWTPNTYLVSYDANKPESVQDPVKGTMKDTKMTYNAESTLRANAYSIPSYKFMGWALTPTGEVKYKDSEEVMNLSDESDVTLYAVWKNFADITDEEEDIDWTQKKLVMIMANMYSVSVYEGQRPDISKLTINAVYNDGSCREVRDFTTNIDEIQTDEDTMLEVNYREGLVQKTLQIFVRVKAAANPSEPEASTTPSTGPGTTASPVEPGSSATPSTNPGASASPSTNPGASATPSTQPGASASPSTQPGASATPSTQPGASASPSTQPGATASPSTGSGATANPTTNPGASATPSTKPGASASPTKKPAVKPTTKPSTNITNNYTIIYTLQQMEKLFNSVNTDKVDLAKSQYAKLQLKAVSGKKKKTVKLTWKSVKGAKKYIIYGASCGKKLKKIKTIKVTKSKKSYSYTVKKLKKNKYYKYMVVACKTTTVTKKLATTKKTVKVPTDGVISLSKLTYVTAKGTKYQNPTKVTMKVKTKLKKAKAGKKYKLQTKKKLTLKKGKTKSVVVKVTSKNKQKKIKKYGQKVRYESSNPKVATVSKKGKIKAVNRGKATIYAFSQNGISKKITVTVK